MRIVAGIAKGRKLTAPKGLDVRPTTDRVKEALFSSIAPRLEGAHVLDLFAGTGALGLESLSRGAASAVFVERSRRTMAVLRENLFRCGLQERSRLLEREAITALRALQRERARFDVVFLDPPYAGPLLVSALFALAASSLLANDGLIVAEHLVGSPLEAPPKLVIALQKRYGNTILSFVQRAQAMPR